MADSDSITITVTERSYEVLEEGTPRNISRATGEVATIVVCQADDVYYTDNAEACVVALNAKEGTDRYTAENLFFGMFSQIVDTTKTTSNTGQNIISYPIFTYPMK